MIIPLLFCCHNIIIVIPTCTQENADHKSSATNTVTIAGDKSEPSPSDFTPPSQSEDDNILVPSTPHSMADLAQIKIHSIPQGIFNFSYGISVMINNNHSSMYVSILYWYS